MAESGKPPSRVGLSVNVRHLVSISALASVGREGELARYIRTALQAGVPPAQIREVFLQVALFAGFPRALTAFETLSSALAASGEKEEKPPEDSGPAPLSDPARLKAQGEAVFRKIYAANAEAVLAHLAGLHPILPDWILADAYGLILSRPGLPLLLREYVAVASLSALDQPGQLLAHMRGALQAGANVALLREVFSHLSLHLEESQMDKVQRLLERA